MGKAGKEKSVATQDTDTGRECPQSQHTQEQWA